MSNKGLAWTALAIGVSLFVGCATGGGSGPDEEETTGNGGAGGAGSGMGGAGPAGPGPGASNSSSSGAQSSSSSSTSASTTGGGACGAGQHMCPTGCMGNTPETGCLQSATCAACPAVANGKTTCNAQGLCDVSCDSGYNKNGNTCVCPLSCCSNAECAAGQTCMGGTCSGSSTSSGGGSCDQFACTAQCLLQNKFGICGPSGCMCVTP